MQHFYSLCFTCILLLSGQRVIGQDMSFAESLNQVYTNSDVLRIAENERAKAKSIHQSLNSSWFPTIAATGSYTWMSDKIEVTQEYKSLLEPFDSYFNKNIITQTIGNAIYNFLGNTTFSVPIMEQNWATIDAAIVYPIFTGGRRIYANAIGKEIENIGTLGEQETRDAIFLVWVETYYGLQLSIENEKVRKENLQALNNHYREVLAFKANGMTNEMDCLIAQVAVEDAERQWKAAQKNTSILQYRFCKMLGHDSTCNYNTTSPLFIHSGIPTLEWFVAQSHNSPLLQAMKAKETIANKNVNIAIADYFPTIAIFGKQTLASYNVPQNLMPPTIVGASFVWNIFDGLQRERKIKQSKIDVAISNNQYNETQKQINTAIHKAYYELENAKESINTLGSTIAMTDELIRIRQAAYKEGMATTTEVIDAQTANAKAKLMLMAEYYRYDMMLATLVALCGIPQQFEEWSNQQ